MTQPGIQSPRLVTLPRRILLLNASESNWQAGMRLDLPSIGIPDREQFGFKKTLNRLGFRNVLRGAVFFAVTLHTLHFRARFLELSHDPDAAVDGHAIRFVFEVQEHINRRWYYGKDTRTVTRNVLRRTLLALAPHEADGNVDVDLTAFEFEVPSQQGSSSTDLLI